MTPCSGLLIFGFGGHARSVADVALSLGMKELIFIDQNAKENETFLHYPVQKTRPASLADGWYCFPASGNQQTREEQIKLAQALNWPIATLISKTATIGVGSHIGMGTLVAHHAHIGPLAKIGTGCIINTAAIVEHDCEIGDYSHISVNATVAGKSKVGRSCFICAGATVLDRIEITDEVTLGAGAVAVKSILLPGTYVGMPCRALKTINSYKKSNFSAS